MRYAGEKLFSNANIVIWDKRKGRFQSLKAVLCHWVQDDENYSKLLIERKDLSLSQVVLLDRVQKKLSITDHAVSMLKREKLIEGRRSNYYVAASVATATDDKAAYLKNKAFDDEHYKKMIESFLGKFGEGTRKDFESLLIPKLSDVLAESQKRAKVKNMLQAMKREKRISLNGRIWKKN